MMATGAVMSAKIGDKNIAYVGTFLVPDKELAEFNIHIRVGPQPAPLWESFGGYNSRILSLNLFLEFVEGPGEVGWKFNDPDYRFIFRGWKNPLGNALKAPIRAGSFSVGTLPKSDFGFLISSYYLEPINVVTLQVVTGGTYE